jgi:hypothetical protein
MAIARTVDDHTMTRSHNGRRSPMTGAIQLIIMAQLLASAWINVLSAVGGKSSK